jgi:hypothetical protein
LSPPAAGADAAADVAAPAAAEVAVVEPPLEELPQAASAIAAATPTPTRVTWRVDRPRMVEVERIMGDPSGLGLSR